MIYRTFAVTLGMLVLGAGTAHAECVPGTDDFQERDSAFGTATLTCFDGQEWLDVDLSLGLSVNELLAELEPGGTFAGYRQATRDEALALFDAAGIPTGHALRGDQNVAELILLVGSTRIGTLGGFSAPELQAHTGTTKGSSGSTYYMVSLYLSWFDIDGNGTADAVYNVDTDLGVSPSYGYAYRGHWLIKDPNAPTGEPDIDITPAAWDFGEVTVGDSSLLIVTVSNNGSADLEVSDVGFTATSSPDFSATAGLPITIAPGDWAEVDVTFAPTADGAQSATLEIDSDDPDTATAAVALAGIGVAVELPPGEQVLGIIDFIDTHLADGTLVPTGNGNHPERRVKAVKNMIEAVGELYEAGDLDAACEQLLDAYHKTDGVPNPPDFVAGEAAPVLADLMIELGASIGCY